MTSNPGKVVTKFQFCSLLNEAWFNAINPGTIISTFRKVNVCPFNALAIQPYPNALPDGKSYSRSNETSISNHISYRFCAPAHSQDCDQPVSI